MSQPQPVLILGLPRSGSSWVGAVLSTAPRTVRRHEVATQQLLRGDGDAFRHLEAGAPDAQAEAAADEAFAKVRRRRLVVKEVLPLLGSWLVDRYSPVVVDLDRHPVAIAESHIRLGWTAAQRERDRLPDSSSAELLRELWPELTDIERKVAYFACVRSHVAGSWGPAARHVRYESLRADPTRGFAALGAELGLGEVQLDVASEGPQTGPYRLKAGAVSYPPQGATPQLREVWDRFAPAGYRDDADWLTS